MNSVNNKFLVFKRWCLSCNKSKNNLLVPRLVLPCIKYSEFFLIYMYYYFEDHIGG